jgi:protein-S-isoprenylcysteine O-methyltransferase Ste14
LTRIRRGTEDRRVSSRARAGLGSLLFLVIAPGTVAVLIPWAISGWALDAGWPLVLRVAGFALTGLGAVALLACFAQFVREGRGTPAPVAPTETLVVHGLYRYVRNPMYLAVGAVILGQALAFPSLGVLVWAAVFAVAVVVFVLAYEQPTLARRYGEEYHAYCRAVPGWWPRRTAWRG